MGRAEIALDCRNLHGEGVFWNDRDGPVRKPTSTQEARWFEPKGGKIRVESRCQTAHAASPLPEAAASLWRSPMNGLLRPR